MIPHPLLSSFNFSTLPFTSSTHSKLHTFFLNLYCIPTSYSSFSFLQTITSSEASLFNLAFLQLLLPVISPCLRNKCQRENPHKVLTFSRSFSLYHSTSSSYCLHTFLYDFSRKYCIIHSKSASVIIIVPTTSHISY